MFVRFAGEEVLRAVFIAVVGRKFTLALVSNNTLFTVRLTNF
jgi:hypothetical protein